MSARSELRTPDWAVRRSNIVDGSVADNRLFFILPPVSSTRPRWWSRGRGQRRTVAALGNHVPLTASRSKLPALPVRRSESRYPPFSCSRRCVTRGRRHLRLELVGELLQAEQAFLVGARDASALQTVAEG